MHLSRPPRLRARLALPGLALILINLVATAPGASAGVDLPVGMARMNSDFPATPGVITRLDASIRVQAAEVEDQGYFYARMTHFPGEHRGSYMGLQTNGGLPFDQGRAPRVARFSVFDNDDDVVDVQPAGGACERRDTDGGDGNFVGCAITYDWQLDRTYVMRAQELSRNAATSRWQGSVVDTWTGRETVIGSISVPARWGWLDGRVGGFVEYFRGALNDCRDMPYTIARFGSPTATFRDGAGINRITIGTASRPPEGYGICGLGRAAQVGASTYLESGFANTHRDAVALTLDHWYRAGMHREPDAAGRAFWMGVVGKDRGADDCARSLRKAAIRILSSEEYIGANPAGNKFDPHGQRTTYLYLSVLHRSGDTDGLKYWNGRATQIGWTNTVSEFTGAPEALRMFELICTRR